MKNPEKNWVHNNDLLHVAPIQKLNHNIVFTILYINQIYSSYNKQPQYN